MGRKIRADLVGTAHVFHADGSVSVLAAGDEIPDGISVGDHLFASPQRDRTTDVASAHVTARAPSSEAPKPRGNAGRDAWAKYAASKGVEFDESASRDDIKAAVEATED